MKSGDNMNSTAARAGGRNDSTQALIRPCADAVLFMLSPDFMRVLWEDPWGVQLLLIAGTLQLLGTFIISRLVRIEY